MCDNNEDDTGNGLVDCDDPTCAGVGSCPAVEDCATTADNDGDGYGACYDCDCTSATNLNFMCSISGPFTCETEVCGNGTDDDGDNAVDCNDPDCATAGCCAVGICP